MTLIELLIAMVLALLVLSTVAGLLAATSRTRIGLERSARLADNARYALVLLRKDLVQAGYYDTLVTSAGGFAWQTPDPGPCATDVTALGWGNPPPSKPAQSITSAPFAIAGLRGTDPTPACLPERKPGTAVLELRFVGPETTPPASARDTPFLQLSKCAAETPNIQNLGVFSANPADFVLHNVDCTTIADVKRYVTRAYYVANCDRCGTDLIPTLKRAELVGNAVVVTSLVAGVENLQIEYGLDADADGTPDRYLEAPDPTLGPAFGSWANVMAVRLYLLVRSSDRGPGFPDGAQHFNLGPAGYVTPAADGYRRVLLTSVVRPMGPAGQREMP